MLAIRCLPKPDEFGTYWLGKHNGPDAGPAIFRSKRFDGMRVYAEGFIAFLGPERGFVWSGTELVRFGSAARALAAINAELTG